MPTPAPDFYLASASPRRRELLAQLRYRFAALQVDIDETPQPGETAAGLVLRLAGQKAAAGARLVELRDPRPVLGADTAVSVDGRILGKPATNLMVRSEAPIVIDAPSRAPGTIPSAKGTANRQST